MGPEFIKDFINYIAKEPKKKTRPLLGSLGTAALLALTGCDEPSPSNFPSYKVPKVESQQNQGRGARFMERGDRFIEELTATLDLNVIAVGVGGAAFGIVIGIPLVGRIRRRR